MTARIRVQFGIVDLTKCLSPLVDNKRMALVGGWLPQHNCREYLERNGKQLRDQVEKQGGQLVVEVRRNAEPQIRVCFCEFFQPVLCTSSQVH
jgi:hypothetical protein